MHFLLFNILLISKHLILKHREEFTFIFILTVDLGDGCLSLLEIEPKESLITL